jgi:hypothetical protein
MWFQLGDGCFCEGLYMTYRQNELNHGRRPLPRGPEFIKMAGEMLDKMAEYAAHPIEIVTDYRTRANGRS